MSESTAKRIVKAVINNLTYDKTIDKDLLREHARYAFFNSARMKTEGCNGAIHFINNFDTDHTLLEFLRMFVDTPVYVDNDSGISIMLDPSKETYIRNISLSVSDFLSSNNQSKTTGRAKSSISFGKSILFIVRIPIADQSKDNLPKVKPFRFNRKLDPPYNEFKFKLFNLSAFQIVGKHICENLDHIIDTFISAYRYHFGDEAVMVNPSNVYTMRRTTQIIMTKLFTFRFSMDLRLFFEALIYQRQIRFFNMSHGNGGLVVRVTLHDRVYPITFQRSQVTINKFYEDIYADRATESSEFVELFDVIFELYYRYFVYLKWIDYNVFRV